MILHAGEDVSEILDLWRPWEPEVCDFEAKLPPMATLVRNRFVALDLDAGWIEHTRVRLWTLSAVDGTASLRLTMFPVANGVSMDLATLRALEHERHLANAEHRREVGPSRVGAPAGRFFVDEASWAEGAIFCVASTHRVDFRPLQFGIRYIERVWTVSDGKYVLEATLQADTQDAFERAAAACEGMMYSVRFEGPS